MNLILCRVCTLICSLVMLIGACGGNPHEAPPSASGASGAPSAPLAPVPTATRPVPSSPPALVPPSAQQLPIAEDFEAETEAAITVKSYKRDLAALGREIEREIERTPAIK